MTLLMISIMGQAMLESLRRFMMWYSGAAHDAAHALARGPQPVMMGGMSDVVETFEARAKSALRHKAALERDLAAMYEMLPAMRLAKKGPSAIEQLSGGLIPRDTASRLTAPVIGTSRRKADAPAS